MKLIWEAMQSPINNLLGIFIYLTLFLFCTILFATAMLYLIPNRLSTRWKNAIIGSVAFIALIISLYYVISKQFF
ncbi:hypothetical protein ACS127_11015 [Amphibacillus sp. Q70]|uniref:hypothetical protein n=1 Tax=Amphibacillus sp. Q70 TaxID=3453416 RepID=UPI003F844404